MTEQTKFDKVDRVVTKIPIVNFLWYTFVKSDPTVDEITLSLETLALVSALTVAVVGALVPAISLSEGDNANLLFSKTGKYGCRESVAKGPDNYTNLITSKFQNELIWATIQTGSALMGSIVALVSMTSVTNDTIEQSSENLIRPWWRLMRYPLFLCWCLFLVGGVRSLIAMKFCADIKFPQYFWESECKSAGWQVINSTAVPKVYGCTKSGTDACLVSDYTSDWDNPSYLYYIVGMGIIITTVVITAACGGYGALVAEKVSKK